MRASVEEETVPSASVLMATRAIRLFAVTPTHALRVLVEPTQTVSQTATGPYASVDKATRATHLSTAA